MPALILFAEDDPAIAIGLKGLLQAKYDVLDAAEGDQALEMILENQPDLVLLDVNLPGRTGISVCQKVREQGFRNPVLMVSARSEQVDKIIGLEAGADDYITKPFDSRELLARIEAHLRRSADSTPQTSIVSAISAPAEASPDCRLLTLMFTDMVGFTKNITEDEPATFELLKQYDDTMRPVVKQYSGSVLNTMGSGFLISFDSAVSAAQCAMALLSAFTGKNPQRDDDSIHIRIGMHFGDVWFEGENASGDTVNIAARLQQMADADTAYISSTLYSSIRKHIHAEAVHMGERALKNIREPLTIIRLKPPHA